jgi:phosphoglycolate phosphatase
MRYSAAVFDLDGTLLNTIDDLADTCNAVLVQYNLKGFTVEEYKAIVGSGAKELCMRVLGNADVPLEEFMRKRAELYDKSWNNKTTVYPGISELLRTLAEKGVLLAVLSNKSHAFTEKMIKHYFPDISFACIYGGREGYPLKPDPKALLEIIDLMGMPKERVLFVGDSGVDIQTAHNAGIKAAGVLWGFRGKDELEQARADYLAADAEGLLDIICG